MKLAHLSRSSLFARGVPPGHYADKLNGRYTTPKQAAPLAEIFRRASLARAPLVPSNGPGNLEGGRAHVGIESRNRG
jgi:hypothetical protein